MPAANLFRRVLGLLGGFALLASAHGASISVEAEAGSLGADWAVSNSASPAYVTITSNSTGSNPGSSNRVASYRVTFPAAGAYQLYARLRVGPNTFNDDSLFYPNGFGVKSPTNNADWMLVNGLGSAGFTNSTDVVTGGGSLGSGTWKWINLSQFVGQGGFSVPAGNLTQTFQLGAREDGLDLDKFVFGTAGYTFTVADLDAGGPGVPITLTATIDATKTYQTIEGLGGATAFYAGWIKDHPYKQEIYSNAFAGLNLSMLRLGDWYRYQTPIAGFDAAASDIVSNANRILGHPVPVFMSSWAPPAFLKSNGQVGNGGTLLYTNGGFAYTNFAQYWYDSIQAYQANGVALTWLSIQNEPDWAASYDSCVFHPTEDTVNGTNYASYAKALDAVAQRLTNLPAPLKILAPEPVGIGYNDVQNYGATMNANSFYGVAYHLYHGSTDGSPDGYTASMLALTNVFPAKPKFMTEFGYTNMMDTACLIHNCLTLENAVGFNFWSLVWPLSGGLINQENPYNRKSWTNAPPGTSTQSHGYWLAPSYWAMKHFSYFINPGFKRVSALDNDANVRVSAFVSSDNLRLVIVAINTNATTASAMTFNLGAFANGTSSVYQTVETNTFQALGPLATPQTLPPLSLTTVVVDEPLTVLTAPRFTSASVSRGALVATGTNGNAPGTLFYTLACTNLTLPLSNWTLIATNQFGAGGSFSITNPVDPNGPRQFFRLRLP